MAVDAAVSGGDSVMHAGSSAASGGPDAGPGTNEPDSAASRDPGKPVLAPALDVTTEPADDAVFVFDPNVVRSYDVIVDPAALEMANMQPSTEAWVPARIWFEGKQYGPYMMRYKGGAGSFRPPCTTEGYDGAKAGKCSFKLGFDEVDPELRFFGLKSLNFQSMNNDDSLLRERLGYSLFRDFGVAAPRATHARVSFNGVYEGLFALVEMIDGRFTRARFADGGEGNVYKEAWPDQDDPDFYLGQLRTNEDENPSVDGMLQLHAAVARGGSAVSEFIDPAYTMRYLAVDRVITNDDGIFHFYCKLDGSSPPRNHNFYWYEAERGGQFWLIPWDLDQSFHATSWAHIAIEWSAPAACICTQVGVSAQSPASCDPMVSTFIEWLPDYEAQVDAFLSGPFAASKVDEKLETWADQLESAVDEASAAGRVPSVSHWRDAIEELQDEIASARQHRGAPY